jgi:hypothetical protein
MEKKRIEEKYRINNMERMNRLNKKIADLEKLNGLKVDYR